VAEHLATIPEVLEAYTTTGAGDVLARIVAVSNSDLQRVIDRVVAFEGVVRTSTVIALDTQIAYRVLPLLDAAAASES
jgi:DNA-binding Lrp family transcriptional regulator